MVSGGIFSDAHVFSAMEDKKIGTGADQAKIFDGAYNRMSEEALPQIIEVKGGGLAAAAKIAGAAAKSAKGAGEIGKAAGAVAKGAVKVEEGLAKAAPTVGKAVGAAEQGAAKVVKDIPKATSVPSVDGRKIAETPKSVPAADAARRTSDSVPTVVCGVGSSFYNPFCAGYWLYPWGGGHRSSSAHAATPDCSKMSPAEATKLKQCQK